MHSSAFVHASLSHDLPQPVRFLGVDFSSAPNRRKPIVVASGVMQGPQRGQVLRLEQLHSYASLHEFAAFLSAPGAWVGGFDLPFGLPRELVEKLGWPGQWLALMQHYTQLPREEIRRLFAAFCAGRPAGGKFAHRACDGPAGSSPSMKWVNPPVAFMLHAGVPLLLQAGATLPGVHQGSAAHKIALEAYPGLLARELLGRRSYKSDDKAKQTPERLIARKDLLEALEQGRSRLGLRLKLSHAQRELLIDDARGDRLDALLCLMQAAWASLQPNWSLPADMDPLEGWIISA